LSREEADGHEILFKIDYYDKTLTAHSPDPADPSITVRRDHDHADGAILIKQHPRLSAFAQILKTVVFP
jgi:hypothetical protein